VCKLAFLLKINYKFYKKLFFCITFIILIIIIKPFIKLDFNKQRFNQVFASYQGKLAHQIGVSPKEIIITGKTNIAGCLVSLVKPNSKWSVLADSEGHFKLPEITWYPGKIYYLKLSLEDNKSYQTEIFAPWEYPKSGNLDLGFIDLELTLKNQSLKLQPSNLIPFDTKNKKYYEQLYSSITTNICGEEEKIMALTKFVCQKRVAKKKVSIDIWTPRQLLEPSEAFSYTCGELSSALAHLVYVGNFKINYIDMILDKDSAHKPYTHVVLEVYYQGKWHLYDPTFGTAYKNEKGEIASYQEIRLNPKILDNPIRLYSEAKLHTNWLHNLYSEGVHQKFAFNENNEVQK
jgi:hypothetical protein